MEESISNFSKMMSTFCNHLQTSSDALKQSIERRPIPLDSASSTFIQCLNRRVTSASTDLNLLESMSFGTVSFEELLGHCNEVYKKNQSDLVEIEDRLKNSGYIPADLDDEEEDLSVISTPLGLDSKVPDSKHWQDPPTSVAGFRMKDIFEEDNLFDESLTLRNLGLSDVCLATIASEANATNERYCNPDTSLQRAMKPYKDNQYETMRLDEPPSSTLELSEGDLEDNLKSIRDSKFIDVSKENYESLPSYMKSLASWEDLIVAVEKINKSLGMKENTKEANFFHQDELTSLGLGSKGRSYLLLLLRMNKLVVETVGDTISYRVL